MTTAVVVGAGPAGFMAAEALADRGLKVIVTDQKPSVSRKFLMAGKSGLNLTMDAPLPQFLAAYPAVAPQLSDALAQFGPAQVVAWAEALGQEVFTGSSGRVFPKAMKASPLLRAWLARLAEKSVEIKTRWRWNGFAENGLKFETPSGSETLTYDVAVLAMGGGSWRRLGSDGLWAAHLEDVAPFKPSNMGFRVDWSPFMARHFGSPIKNLGVLVGDKVFRGEAVITAKGLEGGVIYAASALIRDGGEMRFDLVPDLEAGEIARRWSASRGKDSVSNSLRKRFKLDAVKIALLNEFARDNPVVSLKSLDVPVSGVAPLDEAISTAGGLRFDVVDPGLMLRQRPGVFAAGEMLDWDAPTGGYLITACLATGLWAGRHAADWALS